MLGWEACSTEILINKCGLKVFEYYYTPDKPEVIIYSTNQWQCKLLRLVGLFLLVLSASALAIDTDHDGLPDDWETANGRDPSVADYLVSAGGQNTCALDDMGVVGWG